MTCRSQSARPAGERLVELGQVAAQSPGRWRRAERGVLRVEHGEVGGHRVGDLESSAGSSQKCGSTSPCSWSCSPGVLVCRLLLAMLVVGVAQVDHVGDVEHRALGVLLDGLVDGGLEAVLDDDEVGPGQRDGTREGRLDVMGLHPRSVRLTTSTSAPPTRSATQARG